MTRIMALCGPPRSRLVEELRVRHKVVTGFSRFSGITLDERWEYDRGWGKFPAVLRFQDGKLKRIEYRRYRSGAR